MDTRTTAAREGTEREDVVMDGGPMRKSASSSTPSSSAPRRRPAPSSIPDFPRHKARDPPAAIASPSPTASPPPSSPFASPSRHNPGAASSMLHPVPLPPAVMHGNNGMASPWLALAATSGAPTPSLEGPGKASPHLGYPFERLNIGGSWSGANLLDPTGRRRSLAGDNDPKAPPVPGSGDMFAKYRAMAGHASANAKGKTRSMEVDLKAPEPPMQLRLPQPKAPSPLGPTSSRTIKPLTAKTFPPLVSLPTTLILDLRPPSSFSSSHLPTSHSLPIPSTFLRRPAFSVQKLTEMLPSPTREAVASWREKRDIIMLDADSTRIPENSVMTGLANKFEREGFQGTVWFLQGGHAVLSGTDVDLVADEGGTATPEGKRGPGFMAGKLGSLAFQQGSTGSNLQRRKDGVPTTPGTSIRRDPFSPASSHTERPNPAVTSPGFASMLGSSPRSGSGSGFGGPTSDSGHHQSYSIQPANPFFENIRQNIELSHEGISERISLDLPVGVISRAHEFPDWLKILILLPPREAAERLAGEFYQVELKEQHRLQAVMDWHSRDSGQSLPLHAETALKDDLARIWSFGDGQTEMTDYFPFSISAGVERGTKNRYKNIWPYDFSRVKLDSPPDKDSDYINASYVQPRGTARKYIATQGPLDATYCDFWRLVWEQGVVVIVMLTKQFEGGLLKCGNYWEDSTYGSLRVTLDSQTGGDDQQAPEEPGFNFGSAFNDKATQATEEDQENIHRTFTIRNKNGESRKVVQIQCTAWPDFDVPDSPEVLLNLLRDVNVAVEGLCESGDGRAAQPPVLVHCSAGVGRTGSFIIVDAIIDSLRRDRDLLAGQAVQPPLSRRATDSSSPSPSSLTRPTDSIPASTAPTSRQESLSRSVSVSRSSQEPQDKDQAGQDKDKDKDDMDLDSPSFAKRDLPEPTPATPGAKPSLQTRHTSVLPQRPSTEVAQRAESYTDDMARALRRDFGVVPIMTKSTDRHRTPSPICPPDGSSPVASVLEGMRVQRMSLVQSLRQYIFVHRAIIHSYINMVDSDRHRETSQSSLSLSTTSTNPPYSIPSTRESTSVTSMSTADDRSISSLRSALSKSEEDFETSAKRRASPTELTPDKGSPVVEAPSRAGLSKRLSSKKMRSEPGGSLTSGVAGAILGGIKSATHSRVPSVSPEDSKGRTQEMSSDSTGSSSSTTRPS